MKVSEPKDFVGLNVAEMMNVRQGIRVRVGVVTDYMCDATDNSCVLTIQPAAAPEFDADVKNVMLIEELKYIGRDEADKDVKHETNVDDKVLVHWYGGMKQPADFTGWDYKDHKKGWRGRGHFDGTELDYNGEYRKLMTAEEASVFYALQVWDVACPKGCRIIDFRPPVVGDLVVGNFGAATYHGVLNTRPEFILEKKQHEINWVDPTDQDAVELKRPEVRFRDGNGNEWQYGGRLLGVDQSHIPYAVMYVSDRGTIYMQCYTYCQMDASLRKQED